MQAYLPPASIVMHDPEAPRAVFTSTFLLLPCCCSSSGTFEGTHIGDWYTDTETALLQLTGTTKNILVGECDPLLSAYVCVSASRVVWPTWNAHMGLGNAQNTNTAWRAVTARFGLQYLPREGHSLRQGVGRGLHSCIMVTIVVATTTIIITITF